MQVYRKLTEQEFEQALAIRIKVFVDEQNVPFEEEHDTFDEKAEHFGIFLDDVLVGTGRLIRQAESAKIGRIALLREFRGQGLGSELIRTMLKAAKAGGSRECTVDAQLGALGFYARLGFIEEGEDFFDGGIPHRTMRRQL
ncbi:MAG TPA: GNAT family N-acetyltransferase [Firmicutes bacterium]|nr:GNAT family N-acetyltransferase [Bacillota bacterium]